MRVGGQLKRHGSRESSREAVATKKTHRSNLLSNKSMDEPNTSSNYPCQGLVELLSLPT